MAEWQQTPSTNEQDKADAQLAAALAWTPTLTLAQEAACATASVAAASLMWLCTKPSSVSPPYALGMAAFFAAVLWLLRSSLLEGMYQVIIILLLHCTDTGVRTCVRANVL